MLNKSDFLSLIRFKQWYKNIVIFIPIVFSLNLFNIKLLILTFLGFFSLCFISSSYYILNDLGDIEKDKHHPEKKHRPIASGKIKSKSAAIISLVLFFLSLLISFYLSFSFLYCVIALFLLSQIYNFYIRGIIFLDIILISINFVLRAICGVFVISVEVSPWVILSTFFISLFLVSTKRSTEMRLKNSRKYRPNYRNSDKEILNFLAIVSVTCVFVFFSIYSIINNKIGLLFSIPIALYITLLFFRDSYANPANVRNPEKFIFDKKIIWAILLWFVIVIISFYKFI